VLRDRMAGRLGDSISISELMRRYDIGRPAAQKALQQLSESQAIERGPGQSWLFRPSLNSLAALEESLKFRLILEPEALLSPSFNADPQRLALLRSATQSLLARPVEDFDIQQFRELDISFHELLAQSCGNRFISDALLQHQGLRRLPNLLPSVSVHRRRPAAPAPAPERRATPANRQPWHPAKPSVRASLTGSQKHDDFFLKIRQHQKHLQERRV
jgi:DNA-binding GntR family transcriptional regulator